MSIQVKFIGLLILIGLVFGIHWHGVSQGRRLERAGWQDKDNARISAEQKAALQAIENNTRIAQQQEIDKRKVINAHQTELAQIRAAYERPVARLRITRAICDQPAATAETDHSSGTDATAAGTVVLPESIERDLRATARDADEVTATARALQDAARLSGCYAESTELSGLSTP